MKAIIITRLGGPEFLQLADRPEPTPGPKQVVVNVRTAGLNFADIVAANGAYPGTSEPPFIVGREFSGVVESTGEEVIGTVPEGAFAERLVAHPGGLLKKPKSYSFAEGASFPVNYFTAHLLYWKAGMLTPRTDGKPHRALIHAVAGGVGTAAVQIGKILGIEMYGTASSEDKLEVAYKLGLQRSNGINYSEVDYEAKIKELTNDEGIDTVFEMLGGDHTSKSERCLRSFGSVICYGAATGEPARIDIRKLYTRNTSVHGLWLSKLWAHRDLIKFSWAEMSKWIDEGRLRPIVGHTLPLEKAADAYRMLKDRQTIGKVVLEVSK